MSRERKINEILTTKPVDMTMIGYRTQRVVNTMMLYKCGL